ncbi:MAG: efflux RND transporter periplasmic adaptor subunit [Lactobacillales bacterium]|nr:efflux RND transporter periplasmic adaptor subunit [Lactobacillales bacterium]
MKKLTRKQQIRFSIFGGVAIFLIIIFVAFRSNQEDKEESAESKYQVVTLQKPESLGFKGTVQPQITENFYFDQLLGKISQLSVADGQSIKARDVIAIYQDSKAQDQVQEQMQSLDKYNTAVSNANANLVTAQQKQQDLQNRLNQAKSDLKNVNTDSADGAAQKQELLAKVDSLQQALDAQDDAINQAKQALETSRSDLSSANKAIKQAEEKVTATVTANFDGTVYVNEKGKTDSSTPYATVVSPMTVIKGTVTEYDYKKLSREQKVTIQANSDKKEVDGTIIAINQLPDTAATTTGESATNANTNTSSIANYSFTVIPTEKLQYGYNVQIFLPQDQLQLPKSAVIKEKGNTFVFIYKSGKVHKQKVVLKEENGTYLVESGVKVSDKIISNPDKDFKDGQEVAVEE